LEGKFDLSWKRSDVERKFGFKGKKYTGVDQFFSFLMAILMTLVFYACLYPFAYKKVQYVDMFFHGGEANRSVIPYFTMLLAFWCVAILILKYSKLGLQQRALSLAILPTDPKFELVPNTAEQILHEIGCKVEDPKQFMLLNRIIRCLSNLKNLGNIPDAAEGLVVQAENDENYLESTYTLVKGFIWAIPVLGFIGTVLGLSQAVGGFGKVVSQGAGIEQLKESLSGVTSGLAIAFETTLIALVAALVIQLMMTIIRKREEDFLDECSDYCHRNIISKLKVRG